MIIDSHNRKINYLRLSLTDRCNFRCRYCMPEAGVSKVGHEEVMSYEELFQVVRACLALGINKIRLTGGEPLVRKGVIEFISTLTGMSDKLDLRLTTNGVLLADMAGALKHAGIRKINISLDSLNRHKFKYICGRDELDRVLLGLQSALDHGFERVKINCVAMNGVNDHELVEIARLTLNKPIDVRFIEFMPMGNQGFWTPERFMPVSEIANRISELGELVPLSKDLNDGPARLHQIRGAAGRIGFISALTEHFCDTCNRLRLTADGKLRMCLLSDREINLKEVLRSGADLEGIMRVIKMAASLKPAGHNLGHEIPELPERSMYMIGG